MHSSSLLRALAILLYASSGCVEEVRRDRESGGGGSGGAVAGPSELMLVVETDLEMPTDLDSVRIEVLSEDSLQFGNDYAVGSGGLELPATLGILGGDDPSELVTVRLIGRRAGEARFLREVVTTVPAGRIATLRMPLVFLCDGHASELSPGDVQEALCPAEQTCADGSCTPVVVDSAGLPEYASDDAGSGTCFGAVACFGVPGTIPPGTVQLP